MISAIQQHDFDKKPNKEHHCNRGQNQAQAEVVFALILRHA